MITVTRAAMLKGQEERLARFRALALADAEVFIANVASPPITDREKALILRTVDLMDAIATGVHLQNVELAAHLARCRAQCPEPPEGMSVVA